MHTKLWLLVVGVLLVACNRVENGISTVLPSPPFTPTMAAKPSSTPSPSATLSPIATATSSPTQPDTLTPSATTTFDAFHVITRTSAPPAQCPIKDPALTLETQATPDQKLFGEFTDIEQPVLDFLNSGGTKQALLTGLEQRTSLFSPEKHSLELDVTGDSVPELVVSYLWLFVFSCDNGQYDLLMKSEPGIHGVAPFSPVIVEARDMTKDGIPEIVLQKIDAINFVVEEYYQILGWDGAQLRDLVKNTNTHSCEGPDGHLPRENEMCIGDNPRPCVGQCVRIEDIDGNGTLEFILEGTHLDNAAQTVIDVYMWNGDNFVFQVSQISTPSN